MNRKKLTIFDQIAFLSIRQGVYPAELFQNIVAARHERKTVFQNLTVEYRGSVKDSAIFLITRDSKVVVQFRIAEELLRENITFESCMRTDKMRREMSRRQNISNKLYVRDLRHGMKKIDLEAKVVETAKPSVVQTRYGNSAKVTNAWIADETGKIKLCLWNEQADLIIVGDTVQIKNASVSTFKGEKQVHLGKTASVNVLQSQVSA